MTTVSITFRELGGSDDDQLQEGDWMNRSGEPLEPLNDVIRQFHLGQRANKTATIYPKLKFWRPTISGKISTELATLTKTAPLELSPQYTAPQTDENWWRDFTDARQP